MTWDEFLGEFQVVKLNAETTKPFENDLVLIAIAAVRTPGCDANTSGACDFQSDAPQVMLVVRSDRIGSCLHFLRLRRAEREEIADVECAASPRLSETDATGDGWVVDFVIGGRWVKHDEHAGRKRRVPRTLEPVAILSAGADDGGALHVLSMIGGEAEHWYHPIDGPLGSYVGDSVTRSRVLEFLHRGRCASVPIQIVSLRGSPPGFAKQARPLCQNCARIRSLHAIGVSFRAKSRFPKLLKTQRSQSS